MLANPGYSSAMAMTGCRMSAYVYALNNPLRFLEPSGLAPGDVFSSPAAEVEDTYAWMLANGYDLSVEGAGLVYRTEGNQ